MIAPSSPSHRPLPAASAPEQTDRASFALIAAIALVFGFMVWAHLLASNVDRPLIDEEIVVAVMDHVSAEPTTDTNWANVERVARHYPSTQYNFSSAILAYGLVSGDSFNAEPLSGIPFRHVPVLFAAFALLVYFLTFSALGGPRSALLAISLTALSYQFLSDAISIRPEAFVALLYAAALGFAVWKRPPVMLAALLIGVCGGLLIASKFSMVLVWGQALALMLILRYRLGPSLASLRPAVRPVLLLARVSAAGCVGGIALGAPHALMDLPGTMEGMRALIEQYDRGHYPFGRPDAGVLGRAAHTLVHTQSHLGALTLAMSALAVVFAIRERHWPIAFLAISTALIIGYFAIKPVFFGRNISLFIPVLAFLASWTAGRIISPIAGRWHAPALAVAAIALLAQPVLASWSFSGAVISFEERRRQLDSARGFLEVHAGTAAEAVDGWDVYREPEAFNARLDASGPGLLELRSINDPFSRHVLRTLLQDPRVTVIDPGTARLEGFPGSMIHYNFDINSRFVLVGAGQDADLAALAFESGWCAGTLPAAISGGFTPEGFHRDARPAFPAFGSWLGSDQATATARLLMDSVPENTVLPVMTGPGREGLTVTIGSGGEQQVFTAGQWIGLPLPPSTDSVEIIIEDRGAGWGEWMAFAYPRQVCR